MVASHMIRFYLVVVFSLVGFGVVNTVWAESGKNPSAKDFTLKTSTGKNFRLAENKGKVILLNFWASWCEPCRDELPLLNAMHKKYEKLGFTVLGVNIDEEPDEARRVLDTIAVDFPILMDGKNAVAHLYDIDAMPTTYILDRKGQVRAHYMGYEKGYEKKYDRDVRQLLRE